MQKSFLLLLLVISIVPVSHAETREEFRARIRLEYKTKPEMGGELVRLANSADSREERDGYIRNLVALDLDPLYLRHFAVLLRMDVNTMLRIGLSIPQEEVLEREPEKREEQVSSASTSVQIDRFVMVVHGWNSGPGTPENPNWPLDMGLAYAHVLDDSIQMSDFQREAIGYSLKFDDVEIVVVDWSVIANKWAGLWREGFDKAKSDGRNWGEVYSRRWSKKFKGGPSKVHLIAHSAGGIFIDAFCREIAQPGRQIQATFLDAYLPDDASSEEKNLGEMADFAEHFLHHTAISVANNYLPQAYNMNIIMLKRLIDTITGHDFAYKWYLRVLTRQDINRKPGPIYNVTFGNMPMHSNKEFKRGDSSIPR